MYINCITINHTPMNGECNSYNRKDLTLMGATSGVGTVYPSVTPKFTPGFEWGWCCCISVYCTCFVDCCCISVYCTCFVDCCCISVYCIVHVLQIVVCPFFLSLYCLSFFDLHILITPLVSSNSSYSHKTFKYDFRTHFKSVQSEQSIYLIHCSDWLLFIKFKNNFILTSFKTVRLDTLTFTATSMHKLFSSNNYEKKHFFIKPKTLKKKIEDYFF